MNSENYKYSELTDQIINCFYKVYNTLRYGFLEKVYENALFIELTSSGFKCEKQKSIKVYYDQKEIGEYFADILVNEIIIIELKAAEKLAAEHEYQLINYLKATNISSYSPW